MLVQIVIYDKRNYIIEHKGFKPSDKAGINAYIWKHMKSDAFEIEIKKFERKD